MKILLHKVSFLYCFSIILSQQIGCFSFTFLCSWIQNYVLKEENNDKNTKKKKELSLLLFNFRKLPYVSVCTSFSFNFLLFSFAVIEERDPDVYLCVHYRHFTVGELIYKNIMKAVHNSKATLVILSRYVAKFILSQI